MVCMFQSGVLSISASGCLVCAAATFQGASAPWESCKLHVVALGVELTVLAEQQSDFIRLSRASWACWFQADFHLCLVPLRVTAPQRVCQHCVLPLPSVRCAHMYPSFQFGYATGVYLTCLGASAMDADMLLRNKKVLPLRRFGIRGT